MICGRADHKMTSVGMIVPGQRSPRPTSARGRPGVQVCHGQIILTGCNLIDPAIIVGSCDGGWAWLCASPRRPFSIQGVFTFPSNRKCATTDIARPYSIAGLPERLEGQLVVPVTTPESVNLSSSR
jgi:hypothetical protein